MTTNSTLANEKSALSTNKVLESEGYVHQFTVEGQKLRCTKTRELFEPDDLTIVDIARFEGASDPDDMTIIYVVETKNGRRGRLQDAFGIYASPILGELVERMREDRSQFSAVLAEQGQV